MQGTNYVNFEVIAAIIAARVSKGKAVTAPQQSKIRIRLAFSIDFAFVVFHSLLLDLIILPIEIASFELLLSFPSFWLVESVHEDYT